jgi:two-component system, NtrC family, sensor kinase
MSPGAEARILVVDDELGMRDLLNFELSCAGHEVRVAKDGKEALDALQRDEYDVIVSDVSMPGMSGIDLLGKTREVSPDTEVVMMTGFATMEVAIEALRRGAFDLIQKPLEVCALIRTIARAVERKELRSSSALAKTSQAILSSKNPSRLPELIVETAIKVMGADRVILRLAEDGETPQASTFGTIQTDARGSTIICPLVSSDQLIGSLEMQRGPELRPFQSRDLERAAVVASQVLLALENVRLLRAMISSDRLATIGQIAASIAHEINSPLSYVCMTQGFLSETIAHLEKHDDPATKQRMIGEARELLGDLDLGVTRIREIASDLRVAARSDQDGRGERVDLSDAIKSAIRITAARIRPAATLVTELAEQATVIGSAGRLSQVFVNLLVNAAQAIESSGGSEREIRVSSEIAGDLVTARVSDTGPGIPPEIIERVFEPFFTTKKAGSGTGLGLSISRDIVRAHGGELRVESVLGGGATFVIMLPLARS